jgi:hypothetical protein
MTVFLESSAKILLFIVNFSRSCCLSLMIYNFECIYLFILHICLGSEEAKRKPQDAATAKAGRRRQAQKVGEY